MISISKIVTVTAAIIAGVVLGAGTGAGVAANAQAACPDGYLCLYEHRDFGGQMITFPAGSAVPSLHAYTCEYCNSSKHSGSNGSWGDMLSSWENRSGVRYCQYHHVDYLLYTGYKFEVNLAVAYVGTGLNDEISSFQPC